MPSRVETILQCRRMAAETRSKEARTAWQYRGTRASRVRRLEAERHGAFQPRKVARCSLLRT